MTTLEILDRLVSFATVSSDPNRPLIDFVRAYLSAHGIESEIVEAEGGRKANLFATIGPREVPGIMLSGHTDVVPAHGQPWSSDPFRLKVAHGRAFGRGTADMKGFVASALALAARAASRGLAMPLYLALSHDEEVGCIGVRTLIERLASRPIRPRVAIVGEPTGMAIATGHKGKLAARATCCGSACHSALAPRGLNAIYLACEIVGVLRGLQAEIEETGPRDADYDVPYTTLHAGRIDGGTALNVVPDRCTVDFEIRNVAEDDPAAILARLMDEAEALAAARRDRFPEAAIEIERINDYPGLATPRDSAAVDFLRGVLGEAPLQKVAFGTEGGLFSGRLGVPTLVCGPGSMDQGHKADEFVALDQLAACDAMMDRLLDRIAA